MTAHDTTIRPVRDQRGYDVGVAARCDTCDWWGDVQESYYLATVDLLNHSKRGTE